MFLGNAQNRHASRKRVLMKALVICAEGLRDATIRDLSASGAQLFSPKPPQTDCDVIFKRNDIFVAARVAWIDGHTYGLEFYRNIDPAMLSRSAPEDS
jgi:hypothetical protein